jgi:hypothetical protein
MNNKVRNINIYKYNGRQYYKKHKLIIYKQPHEEITNVNSRIACYVFLKYRLPRGDKKIICLDQFFTGV